jgi:hypothetical protein
MKVSDVNSSKAIGRTRRKKKAETKGDDFADHLSESIPNRDEANVLDTSMVQAVDSILGVQEVPDATEERSRRLVIQYGMETNCSTGSISFATICWWAPFPRTSSSSWPIG